MLNKSIPSNNQITFLNFKVALNMKLNLLCSSKWNPM